ncbi:MAG: YHYH protein [Planctomycetota bacterium]
MAASRPARSFRARQRFRFELLERRMLLHGGHEPTDNVTSESTEEISETALAQHGNSSLTHGDHSHSGVVQWLGHTAPRLHLGASTSESGLTISFEVTPFDLSEDAVDGPHFDGQGHLHLYVNGEKVSRIFGGTYELTDLDGDHHVITADMNSNDHRTYLYHGEKIETTIEVYSEDFIGPIPELGFQLAFGASAADTSIPGIDAGDSTATVVHTAGDFNGDDVDDFLVSAPGGDEDPDSDVGEVYLVFGSEDGLPSSIDLTTLTGLNGIRFVGADAGDQIGVSIGGGGDINGDGFDDIVIGAPAVDPNGRTDAGAAYVVFGSDSFGASFNLANLNGDNGFRVDGDAIGDSAGQSVAIARDVNDDGLDDIIVGAPLNDIGGSDAGAAYVIYGSTNPFSATISLSNIGTSDGVRFFGASEGDNLGYSVDTAGDINGDSIGDIVLGAPTGFGTVTTSCDSTNTVGLIQCAPDAAPGYTLFAPNRSTQTYLVDDRGFLVNSWSANQRPGLSAQLLDDGSLLRTANTGGANFSAGGQAGAVEIYDWDGNLTWQYSYTSTQYRSHHDVEILPNGNVLMLAWELKTQAEAIQAGRNPALLDDGQLWPDHIIEVEPTGPTTGDIVWQWNAWDHLIQDFDPLQDNFGDVAANPQLIDINYMRDGGQDWIRTTSIDYNAELDQILLGVHGFSEIWVIDHSTTTAEAASHSGGNSGKGGDLLYRWGNPQAYGRGTAADRELFSLHDAQWIDPELPGAGNILVFNNGQQRPGGNASSVEEITPPVDASGHYALAANEDYGPDETTWSWPETPTGDFFAQNLSGAHRLPNGNTLITHGPQGRFLEVDGAGSEVFEYINPVNNNGAVTQGTNITNNAVFHATKYPPGFPGFAGKDLTPGSTVETGSNSTSMTFLDRGSAAVVFGSTSLVDLSVSTLAGGDGFQLQGVGLGDQFGYSVSGAGDVNGDGLDDMILGSPRAKVDGVSIGAAYVVLGTSDSFSALQSVSDLDGTNGYRLAGDYESDPLLNSLFVNQTGATGYNGAVVNFDSVVLDDDYVHIHTSGIPHYSTIGPWAQNPNDATDQDVTFYIPRHPEVESGAKSPTRLGAIGTWIDGTAIFNWSDGRSYQNQGNWNQLAVIFEGVSFDACSAHPPGNGTYHTHGVPTCLVNELGDDGSGHSPILGWSFDGFPIYGPYGYIDGDPNAGIERIESSWSLRNITNRVNGPSLAAQPLGSYREDFEYVAGSGDLDQYNGRFSPTPEYPGGVYHYHVTVDALGDPAFPYVVGLEYNGVVGHGNGNNGGADPVLAGSQISVSNAGDLNGDGFADVVIGDPQAYVNGFGVAGSATVVNGHDDSAASDIRLHQIDATTGMHLHGDESGGKTGMSVAYAGDVDSDENADLLIGSPGSQSDTGEASLIFGTRPVEVEGIQINDGDSDRSSLTSITVRFDREVSLADGAFAVANRDTGATLTNLSVSNVLVDGKTSSEISFGLDPSTVAFGNGDFSLIDGNYQVVVSGDMVTDASTGQTMSTDFVFGDEATDDFFRFYGDTDGDRDIDGQDFGRFALTFLKTLGDPLYRASLDSDGDGDVDGQDYGRFSSKFLQTLDFV